MIEWTIAGEVQIGSVNRPTFDKRMYLVWRRDDGTAGADVDTSGDKWDDLDMHFGSMADAKQWCEMHWATVGWEGKK